jgi:hypothetical protein
LIRHDIHAAAAEKTAATADIATARNELFIMSAPEILELLLHGGT